MADALCGPSNALQNFQKHTAVDRTLQQDRIVNRHPSTQVPLFTIRLPYTVLVLTSLELPITTPQRRCPRSRV
jgi:hypothetical protein